MSTLMLHTGGRLCSYDELKNVPTPAPVGKWFPVSHQTVLDTVCSTLEASGYEIKDRKLALARDNHRFFGTLKLGTKLAEGVSLAVGIRNSTDKSFPLGFCAGSSVFVCDNLAFRAELLVRNKHTKFGHTRFQNRIAGAVQELSSFQQAEQNRIADLMNRELTDDQALAFIVRAMEKNIIAAPTIPKILTEWRNATYDYGTGDKPTAWKLLNCFTTVLGPRATKAPNEYAGQTIRLNAMISDAVPVLPSPLNHSIGCAHDAPSVNAL